MLSEFCVLAAEPAVFRALTLTLAGLAVAAREPDSVGAIPFRREIRFGRCDAARCAAFPPFAGRVFPVAAVFALVIRGRQGCQIPELIVGPVAVAMMDLIAVRDRTVRALPDPAMLANNSAVIQLQLRVSVASDPAVYYTGMFHPR